MNAIGPQSEADRPDGMVVLHGPGCNGEYAAYWCDTCIDQARTDVCTCRHRGWCPVCKAASSRERNIAAQEEANRIAAARLDVLRARGKLTSAEKVEEMLRRGVKSRRITLFERLRTRFDDSRTAIALWIAPWLEDE